MSYQFHGIRLMALGGLLVGCAYPSLEMGEGAGGAKTTAPAVGSGGSMASGGAGMTTVPSSGGTVVTPPSNGGAVTTTAKGGSVGVATGGTGVVTPSNGGVTIALGGRVGAGGLTATSAGTGVVTPSSGGVVTTATTASSAGSTGAAPACASTTNLVALALSSSTTGNWIGGDSAVTIDNPCGVQGAIFAYSDLGIDKAGGSADDTIQSPARDPASTDSTVRLSPCLGGKCCISGATSRWPVSGTTTDYTASVWGGGIGITLNDRGAGTSSSKLAYSGPATGFNLQLSGTLNGQSVRVLYTQSATDMEAPFKQIASLGQVSVPFTGVGGPTCATWYTSCVAPGMHPFDLEIQVVGGDVAGTFSLCIDSITPIL
jgi:hypothetical protein